MIIAVDGYSSTGKSTVAKIIASDLNLSYIDTGAMYRAITLYALRSNLIIGTNIDKDKLFAALNDIHITFQPNNKGENTTFLNGENVEQEIRLLDVSNKVSLIASIDFIREFLVAQQRLMGTSNNIIMDGRDIGSIVFPNADVKFFISSSPEIRAQRRYNELINKGENVDYKEIEQNIRERDYIDTHREISPLVQVDDAIFVDSSNMNINEVVRYMKEQISLHLQTL